MTPTPEQRATDTARIIYTFGKFTVDSMSGPIAEVIREAVEEVKDDYDNAIKGAMAEECDLDMRHCTCVPLLRIAVRDARKAASVEWEPYIGHRTQDPVCEMFNPFTDTPYPCTCGLDDLREEMEASK